MTTQRKMPVSDLPFSLPVKRKDTTDKKMDSMERIGNENTETEDVPMNEEQERVIQQLEGALSFLKNVKIKNKESFVNVKKPLDDFLSSLKYLPSEPSFEILPTEIKTDILSYLCDTGAFVTASVCQEWKAILLKSKLKTLENVTIGKHCYKCEDDKCFMPEEILKASITLKLDIELSICHTIADVDIQLIIEALTNKQSKFSIEGECSCMREEPEDIKYEPILNDNQYEKLFKAIGKMSWSPGNRLPIESINLSTIDLTDLNQNRLINCLVNKTMTLTLDEGKYGTIIDVEQFVGKLLNESNLPCLTLYHLKYPNELSVTMADALCNVFFLDTWSEFHFKTATIKRLIQNILTRPKLKLKSLDIGENIDWRELISPDNLKILLNKLLQVGLRGNFTTDQVEIANSLPGVEASSDMISKDMTQ